MKYYIKLIKTSLFVALICVFYACEDKDFDYKGNLDLDLLNLTQAREIWNGAECNQFWSLSNKDNNAENIRYKLDISLYQNRTAKEDVSVKLIVNKDSLNKAIQKSDEGGIYSKYATVALLPEDFYNLSSDHLTLLSGNQNSESVSVTFYSKKLAEYIKDLGHDATFVLPLKIVDSSSYTINNNTGSIMLFLNLNYLKPDDPEAYVADKIGVSDDHELSNGMKLKWHDEFNDFGGPNSDMWRFEKGFVRNEEDQWYQEDNAKMDGDGALVIEGRREAVKNPNYQAGSGDWKRNREYSEYTSSCIVAKDKYVFKYGRVEVRAKVPITQGAWPAIWSTGSWWEWPLGGEIDIMEFYKNKIHANLCWGGNNRWQGTWHSKNYPISDFKSKDPNWAEKYHIWVMEWDEKFIRLYLDDELLNETDLSTTYNKGDNGAGQGGYENPFSNDYSGFGQRMMLNLAIGGNNGRPVDKTQLPMKYYIDYIRVYQ